MRETTNSVIFNPERGVIDDPSRVKPQRYAALPDDAEATDRLISDRCAAVLAHWRALPREGRLPARDSFEPLKLVPYLPFIYLIDVLRVPDVDFRYRLVGTDIVANIVGDPTGACLSELQDIDTHCRLVELYRKSADKGDVRVQRLPFENRSGVRCWYETVAMPLAADGQSVDMLLGVSEHFRESRVVSGETDPEESKDTWNTYFKGD